MLQELKLQRIHHISIICSDFTRSRKFYTEVLGLKIIQEIYRSDRDSYKLDLALNGVFVIELFNFPETPERLSYPEACGLRHLAFEVNNIEDSYKYFVSKNIDIEKIRTDEHTLKKYTFLRDPDNLPIELYER